MNSVPMIDTDNRRVRLDLIANSVRGVDDIGQGVTTYRTRHLDGMPEFVVVVDDWAVAQYVGELAFKCADLGLVNECRALLDDAHMSQLPKGQRTVLTFEGWTLVTERGAEVEHGLRQTR